MIFYDLLMKYKPDDTRLEAGANEKLQLDKEASDANTSWSNLIKSINRSFGTACGLEGDLSAYIWKATPGAFNIIIAANLENVELGHCIEFLQDEFAGKFAITDIEISVEKELSTTEFNNAGERGASSGYIIRWVERALKNDFFDNNTFKVEEFLLTDELTEYEAAKKLSDSILADKSLYDELDRIYSSENSREYFGNPVHYCISATNEKSAMDIVKILTKALYVNNRLLGKRVAYISEITEHCFREQDIKNLISNAQGCTVVINLTGADGDFGNYATAFMEVIEYFSSLVKKYHLKTLFVFVKQTEKPGFADSFLAKVCDDIDIINIKEGVGGRKSAFNYLKSIITESNFKVSDEDIERMLGRAGSYSVTDIYKIYNSWFKSGLRTNVYKAYANCMLEHSEERKVTSSPYEELSAMVGLNKIKEVTDDIICSYRIRKIRSEHGLGYNSISKHMIFTGNPGSAKTTVARLIADILRLEGVLDTGRFVECGRADLVGKYVGWTARLVKEKFRAARGGVLFIDEAYALVDETGSFGTEAINTIVQEMENYRDDVIVIFAGYKESMKRFLDANEGLRSRIAFHLDFPDYTPDEMLKILQNMAAKRGFVIDADAMKKCSSIFEVACQKEQFGNGRFARNLIEQAELAQAKRLIKDKDLDSVKLTTLIAQDFNYNLNDRFKESKMPLGFVV